MHLGVNDVSRSSPQDAGGVFLADLVVQRLRDEQEICDRDVIVAADLFAIVEDLLGSRPEAVAWWAARPATVAPVNRTLVHEVTAMVRGNGLWALLDEHADLARAWLHRCQALAGIRAALPTPLSIDLLLDLLVSHHSRHETALEALRLAALSGRTDPAWSCSGEGFGY